MQPAQQYMWQVRHFFTFKKAHNTFSLVPCFLLLGSYNNSSQLSYWYRELEHMPFQLHMATVPFRACMCMCVCTWILWDLYHGIQPSMTLLELMVQPIHNALWHLRPGPLDNSYSSEETPRGVPPVTSSQAIIGYYGMQVTMECTGGTPIPYMAVYTGMVAYKYIDSRCVCSNADVPQNFPMRHVT